MNQIIFLNGTSSSGKSSIAKALQNQLADNYLHLCLDNLIAMMPDKSNDLSGEKVSEGFYWQQKKLEDGSTGYSICKGDYGSKINSVYKDIVNSFLNRGLKLIIDDVLNGNAEM